MTPSGKPPGKDTKSPGKVHTVLGLDKKKVETMKAHYVPKPPPLSHVLRSLWSPHVRKYSGEGHLPTLKREFAYTYLGWFW